MTPPTLSGLHRVTFPVTDLDGTMTWFETVFGPRRLAELDHHDEHGFRFAVVLRLAGVAPLVALRHTQDVTEEVSQWARGVAGRAELAGGRRTSAGTALRTPTSCPLATGT